MAKAPKFELKCEKCGRPQPKDEKKDQIKILMYLTTMRNASVEVILLCLLMDKG